MQPSSLFCKNLYIHFTSCSLIVHLNLPGLLTKHEVKVWYKSLQYQGKHLQPWTVTFSYADSVSFASPPPCQWMFSAVTLAFAVNRKHLRTRCSLVFPGDQRH